MNGMKNKKRKTKKINAKKNKLKKILLFTGLFLLFFLLVFFIFISKDTPSPKTLSKNNYPESSVILDRNGKLLYEIFVDKKRTSIELNEVPKTVKEATLAIEDVNFYKHMGFDIKGIIRGLYRTLIKKRLQGGSTITQQLVKNALLTPERTWTRKIKEALLTVSTEILYDKDQILEMYFNQTPYGGTLWGIQSASRGIFNKDVGELNLAESALLAGLPASPTRYSPFLNPDLAKQRQEMVLERMKEVGFINDEEYKEAIEEELNYYVNKNIIEAPHFVFYVKELLTEKYGLKKVTEGGLKITTSLDLDIQKFAETSVASETAKLKRYNVTNGATVVTNPKTGEILAMVGSENYFSKESDGKYNVTTALRQPGSSIKPLNYAVALELGNITASSKILDDKTCFMVENQKPYCPTNYGYSYYGNQSVRNTLANSLNIGAVKVMSLNGVETFIASASAMGISTFVDPANYGLSLTLGGGEVKMIDMAVAFGVFANMGTKQELVPILKIEDKHGEVLEEYNYIPGERVLSRETSFLIQQILSDDNARSMVFGAGSLLNIKGHPEVAVKTGTTNDLRDNWAIGYTQDFVVVTWVGNNDNSKMSGVVSGTSGAAPIWNKIMTELLKDTTIKKPVRPAEIVGMQVCNLTGGAIPEEGCDSYFEYFKKEFLPYKIEIKRETVKIDKETGKIVQSNEKKENVEEREQSFFEDAYGDKICIDCPVILDEGEENN